MSARAEAAERQGGGGGGSGGGGGGGSPADALHPHPPPRPHPADDLAAAAVADGRHHHHHHHANEGGGAAGTAAAAALAAAVAAAAAASTAGVAAAAARRRTAPLGAPPLAPLEHGFVLVSGLLLPRRSYTARGKPGGPVHYHAVGVAAAVGPLGLDPAAPPTPARLWTWWVRAREAAGADPPERCYMHVSGRVRGLYEMYRRDDLEGIADLLAGDGRYVFLF